MIDSDGTILIESSGGSCISVWDLILINACLCFSDFYCVFCCLLDETWCTVSLVCVGGMLVRQNNGDEVTMRRTFKHKIYQGDMP
jgi:hypothetical protein